MEFINREAVLERLDSLMKSGEGSLAVVWGRRRVGKTRLLVEWLRRRQGLYFVADQSSPSIQRTLLARVLDGTFPAFSSVEYPDWSSLLSRLASEAERAQWRGPLVIDELPYLVESSPELPSVLQRWIDHESSPAGLVVVVAGSSQRMMQGIVLDGSAPLYGRARQLITLRPLGAAHLPRAFKGIGSRRAVEHYAVWGGIPRYWELAREHQGSPLEEMIDRLVLDPRGPLHDEPERLLLEETPPGRTLRPVLDAVGLGAHRLSEIAARTGHPATSLSHPVSRLAAMGLLRREVPFGAPEKSGKRSLYRIADPFARMWFRVVAPHKGFLLRASSSARKALWRKHRPRLIAEAWEDLCRDGLPLLAEKHPGRLGDGPWNPAQRFWKGNEPEWDAAMQSLDNTNAVLAEAKWLSHTPSAAGLQRTCASVLAKPRPSVPALRTATLRRALCIPDRPSRSILNRLPSEITVFGAGDIVAVLA